MSKKTHVVYIEDNTQVKNTDNTFCGHIVHCRDLDSGDEFNVEVMINEKSASFMDDAEKAAKKHELCQLSGNTFETEYVQLSGRRVRQEKYLFITELRPTDKESEELLNKATIE